MTTVAWSPQERQRVFIQLSVRKLAMMCVNGLAVSFIGFFLGIKKTKVNGFDLRKPLLTLLVPSDTFKPRCVSLGFPTVPEIFSVGAWAEMLGVNA